MQQAARRPAYEPTRALDSSPSPSDHNQSSPRMNTQKRPYSPINREHMSERTYRNRVARYEASALPAPSNLALMPYRDYSSPGTSPGPSWRTEDYRSSLYPHRGIQKRRSPRPPDPAYYDAPHRGDPYVRDTRERRRSPDRPPTLSSVSQANFDEILRAYAMQEGPQPRPQGYVVRYRRRGRAKLRRSSSRDQGPRAPEAGPTGSEEISEPYGHQGKSRRRRDHYPDGHSSVQVSHP